VRPTKLLNVFSMRRVKAFRNELGQRVADCVCGRTKKHSFWPAVLKRTICLIFIDADNGVIAEPITPASCS